MQLAHLSLTDFRNYPEAELAFEEGHQLFLGRNGSGKTNLLEAIHLLGTGTSQRASRDGYLVRHGAGGFRVGARLTDDEGRGVRVEIVQSGGSKRVLLNKESARASDLLQTIKVVSFSPADVELVQESGRVRRKFLDLIGCQLSAEYLQLLREYQKAIRQRNETLTRSFAYTHGRAEAERAREPWTDLVIELGSQLFLRRRDLIADLGVALRDLTESAFRGQGPVEATYEPGIDWEGEDPRDELAHEIERAKDKDQALGYTTVGPHTDDLGLHLSGKELRRYGSLGQQQLGAMFLKLSQADLVRTKVGASPLLLVDEMFAILDRQAAEEFLGRVEGEGQIFLATAQEGWLGELRDRRFHVHEVSEGVVRPETTSSPSGSPGNPD